MAGKTQKEAEVKQSSLLIDKNGRKQVLFMGFYKPYEHVMAYYNMMMDSFNKWCSDDLVKHSPEKIAYVISFKERIDGIANLLEIESDAVLPESIMKKTSKPQKNESKNDSKKQAKTDSTGTENIPE